MIELALALWLSFPSQCVLCPAYPGDPPWREATCFMLSRMGVEPDREPWVPRGAR